MNKKIFKNYHIIHKGKLEHKRINSIIRLLPEIIRRTEHVFVPPINDYTPYFFYRTPPTDKSRNMILISLSTWDCGDKLQKDLLDLLQPIREFYLSYKYANNLDAYGIKPSEGKCSRFTFNIYPTNGFLNWHTDPCGSHYPYVALFLLNDMKDHSLQIKYDKNHIGKVDSINYEKGDVVTFYPSYTHRVNLKTQDKKR